VVQHQERQKEGARERLIQYWGRLTCSSAELFFSRTSENRIRRTCCRDPLVSRPVGRKAGARTHQSAVAGCANAALYQHPKTGQTQLCQQDTNALLFWGFDTGYTACKDALERAGWQRLR
jgi:hypothetical protein